jgi:hypothetical protein
VTVAKAFRQATNRVPDFEVPRRVDFRYSDFRELYQILFQYGLGRPDLYRENYITPSSSGTDYTTGYAFSTLGRFPIYLPMTPTKTSAVLRGPFDTAAGQQHLNSAPFGSERAYSNVWGWEDYLETTPSLHLRGQVGLRA